MDYQEALQSLHAYVHHNLRMSTEAVAWLKSHLDSPEYPMLVPPLAKTLYRGDVMSVENLRRIYFTGGLDLPLQGEGSLKLQLLPGSSWTYSLDQAEYHATTGSTTGGASVIYEAGPASGAWLCLRHLYKTPAFKGLRTEEEVIFLDSSVQCRYDYIIG